jgi:hypothetical protein
MADQTASQVIFHNNGGFTCSFSVQWEGGETGRTEVIALGGNVTLNLNTLTVPPQISCWARVYISGGVNHDSGRNFNYDAKGGTAVYTISGTTLNPSFD